MNDKNFIKDYQRIFQKYGEVNAQDKSLELYKCIGQYELHTTSYQKDTLLAFINKYFKEFIGASECVKIHRFSEIGNIIYYRRNYGIK